MNLAHEQIDSIPERRLYLWVHPVAIVFFVAVALAPVALAWVYYAIAGLPRASGPLNPTLIEGPHGFPLRLRSSHYLNLLVMVFMVRSGLSILHDEASRPDGPHGVPGTLARRRRTDRGRDRSGPVPPARRRAEEPPRPLRAGGFTSRASGWVSGSPCRLPRWGGRRDGCPSPRPGALAMPCGRSTSSGPARANLVKSTGPSDPSPCPSVETGRRCRSCPGRNRIRGRKMKLNWLLAFIPVAIAIHWYGANPIVVFAASALALVPLAGLMGDATDALASYVGPT